MSLFSTQGIVLRTQKLGEADKLLTFFTLHRGKLSGVAKRARKMRNTFGASLEPFSHINMVFFERRPGTLVHVNQCSILTSFSGIQKDLAGISVAGRMARLVSLLTPESEPNSRIFKLLLLGLHQITKGEQDLELILRFFEIHLLNYSGYRPKVDLCLRCQEAPISGKIFFSAEAGGTLCEGCHRIALTKGEPVSKGTLAFLSQSLRMDWGTMDRLRAPKSIRYELLTIMETSISHIRGRSFHHVPLTPEV